MKRLLTIDAGNTNTVFGLFSGNRLKKTWRVPSGSADIQRLVRKFPAGLLSGSIDAVAVSSVVPSLKGTFQKISRRLCGRPAFFVGPYLKMPIRLRVKNPRSVGQDRIVNAAAAYMRWKCGLIVVDLGTATTCDVITPRGDYIGGTISPGIGIANAALHEKTALLPLVPIARPKRAVGRDTVEAIRSGVFYGYIGLIDGLVERLRKELSFPVKVIATGGLSAVVAQASRTIAHVDANLTLKGLRLLYLGNARRAEKRANS